jgi:predicted component of type VI protein secretion system
VQLILRIVGGPAQGRRIVIRRGQHADIGRTEWADFSIPNDRRMADVHLRIVSSPDGYHVTDISPAGQLHVNDQLVKTAPLHSGDRILAGESMFAVEIEGEPVPGSFPKSSPDTETPGGTDSSVNAAGEPPVAEQCRLVDLSDAARQLAAAAPSPGDYVRSLAEKALFSDAIRVLAFLVPKPAAVAWCAECVRETWGDGLGPGELQALEAAELWAEEPTEDRRRQAEQAAASAGTNTAAGWVAFAAFWSGGSLSPAGLPEVPPSPLLTAKAIFAALMLAAPQGNPGLASERYRSYVERGMGKLQDVVE